MMVNIRVVLGCDAV